MHLSVQRLLQGREGASRWNCMSILTLPVNYSEDPLLDGIDPFRSICMASAPLGDASEDGICPTLMSTMKSAEDSHRRLGICIRT